MIFSGFLFKGIRTTVNNPIVTSRFTTHYDKKLSKNIESRIHGARQNLCLTMAIHG